MRKRQPFLVTLGKAIVACFEDQSPPVKRDTVDSTSQIAKDKPTSPEKTGQDMSSRIEWISVKTKKPELFKKVTIYTEDKEVLHEWARVNDNDYIHATDDRTVNNVTDWIDVGIPGVGEVKSQ